MDSNYQYLYENISSYCYKNTDVLILGDNPGSKYEKAKELKITIWDEEELKKRLGDINE